MKIAIDGPAGAGKSTISKAVAGELNYLYIDTGAMYRSVGLAAVEAGINTRSETELAGIIGDILIDIKNTEDGQKYYLNGRDVTQKIREPQISMAASDVAVIPAVRLKLVELQRKLAEKTDVVMDGRDIGTYVLRDAELKIFLTASPEARARRRQAELAAKGVDADYDTVLRDIRTRDDQDTHRAAAPLRQAEDAVLVDTSELDFEQSFAALRKLVEQAAAKEG